jgi:hypothetical protein
LQAKTGYFYRSIRPRIISVVITTSVMAADMTQLEIDNLCIKTQSVISLPITHLQEREVVNV